MMHLNKKELIVVEILYNSLV